MSGSVFSQTTFPAIINHQGQTAIVINESQMDSINITYAKLRLLRVQNQKLQLEFEASQKQIGNLSYRVGVFKKIGIARTKLIANKNKEIRLSNRKHELEIEFYKKRPRGNLKTYIIGVAVGIIVGVSVF